MGFFAIAEPVKFTDMLYMILRKTNKLDLTTDASVISLFPKKYLPTPEHYCIICLSVTPTGGTPRNGTYCKTTTSINIYETLSALGKIWTRFVFPTVL